MAWSSWLGGASKPVSTVSGANGWRHGGAGTARQREEAEGDARRKLIRKEAGGDAE